MPGISLHQWVTREFPRTWTHIVHGSFTDPQLESQNSSDLFCYDRAAGVGKFFATVKQGRLDNGIPVQDGPHEIGGPHALGQRWTHVARVGPLQLLFYDASAGVAEIRRTDGKGGLTLQKRYTTWRPSWTQIVHGRFGSAQVLLYDGFNGRGEFHSVSATGEMKLIRASDGWRESWHSIVCGNFSNSSNDDLLFYDKLAGVGQFYKVSGDARITMFNDHPNWRTTWAKIVPGQFLETASYDGLLFYEDSGYTEAYSTNGGGGISQIETRFGNEWALPWRDLLAGTFIGNLAPISTSDLVGYDQRDGVLRYFHVVRAEIRTVFDLNGRWTDGGTAAPVISVSGIDLSIDMSAHGRPPARGSIVDSQTIRVTFPDDATYTATLRAPGTLRWSNGTAWTKVAGAASNAGVQPVVAST